MHLQQVENVAKPNGAVVEIGYKFLVQAPKSTCSKLQNC